MSPADSAAKINVYYPLNATLRSQESSKFDRSGDTSSCCRARWVGLTKSRSQGMCVGKDNKTQRRRHVDCIIALLYHCTHCVH